MEAERVHQNRSLRSFETKARYPIFAQDYVSPSIIRKTRSVFPSVELCFLEIDKFACQSLLLTLLVRIATSPATNSSGSIYTNPGIPVFRIPILIVRSRFSLLGSIFHFSQLSTPK